MSLFLFLGGLQLEIMLKMFLLFVYTVNKFCPQPPIDWYLLIWHIMNLSHYISKFIMSFSGNKLYSRIPWTVNGSIFIIVFFHLYKTLISAIFLYCVLCLWLMVRYYYSLIFLSTFEQTEMGLHLSVNLPVKQNQSIINFWNMVFIKILTIIVGPNS